MKREDRIVRVTLWGAAGNIILAAFKLLAGFAGHSAAMVADAIHSLTDLVSDAVVLVMVKVSSRDRDRDHDYGHGKFETLATTIVSLILLAVGIGILGNTIEKIRLVISGETLAVPGRIALWAAIASIVVKEALFRWTYAVGKKENSQAAISNAWHHRSDALSSIGSALGIGGAILLGGRWSVLDPIAGAVISIVIVVVSVRMLVPAVHELTEGSLPDETEDEIEKIICNVPGIENVHSLKTRKIGPSIIIDSHIVVNPEMSVQKAHSLTVEAESALRDRFGMETQISIHVEPSEEAD